MSEFGKGLTYCIGLFLAHSERPEKYKQNKSFGARWPELWFNGASDHLYDLDTSQITEQELQKELDSWQKKVLHWGHGFQAPSPTKEDVLWSIKKAKEFLMQIDEKMLKTKTEKADWD